MGIGTATPSEKLHVVGGNVRVDNLAGTGTRSVYTDPNGTLTLTPGTGAAALPVGTTAQQPASPATGNIRYNTTIGGLEYYNGATWLPLSSSGLTNGRIWVGNASNIATAVTMSGDVAIDNAGAATIQDNSVDGTDIAITGNSNGSLMYYDGTDWVNLAPGTNGYVLRTNAAAAPTWVHANTLLADADNNDGITLVGTATDLLDVNVQNGLNIGGGATSDMVELGGPLVRNTTVTQDAAETMTFANTGSGAFSVTNSSTGGIALSTSGAGNITTTSTGAGAILTNLAGTGDFAVQDGGVDVLSIYDDGTTVINETGTATQSFRVEGDNEANLLYTSPANDRIGIGTATPYSRLHIQQNGGAGALGPVLTLMSPAGSAGAGAAIDFNGYDPGAANAASARMQSLDDGTFSSHLRWLTKVPGANTNALAERMRIQSDGLVGIGTASPSNLLHVGAAESQGIRIGVPNDAMGLNGGSYAIEFYGYRDVVANAIGAKITAERTNVCCGWLSQGLDLAFYTNNGLVTANADNSTERMRIFGSGEVRVSNLAGTGVRPVVADATGILKTDGKAVAYSQDRNTYAHNNTNAGYRTTGAATGALYVNNGDVIVISHTSKFRWTAGSGGDHPFYGVQVTGTCGTINITEAERIGTADDVPRGQWQTIAGNFVWVATCSGNVQFQIIVDNNSDADDNSEYRDIVLTAIRY